MTAAFSDLTDDEFASLLAQRKAAARTRPAQQSTSPIQREILVASAIGEAGSAVYTVAQSYDISGTLDLAALERAASGLFRRHALLRTTFQHADADGANEFRATVRDVPRPALHILDLGQADPAGLDRTVEDAVQRLCARGLDPGRDPLARLSLIRATAQHAVLVVQVHHVAMDRSSWLTLMAELTEEYDAALAGRERRPPRWRYSDYIALLEARQQDGTYARYEAYWRTVLADPPAPLVLPDSRLRPSPLTSTGRARSVEPSAPVAGRLRELAARWGVSGTALYLAAYAAALARIADRTDFVVGVVVSDRPTEELGEVMGTFVYSLPVRLRLSDGTDWHQFARAAQDGISGAASHPLPLSNIARLAGIPSEPDRRPVVQALFNSYSFPATKTHLGAAPMAPRKHETHTSEFDVSLVLFERGEQVSLQLVVNPDVIDEPVSSSLVRLTLQNLERLSTRPHSRVVPPGIPAIPRARAEDGRRLPAEWSSTEPVTAFWRQADEHPGQVAIRWGEESLSYADVRDRAGLLADRLHQLGVGADDRVGLAAPHSPALVVATLAILSRSATVVAIDPEWPSGYLDRVAVRVACRADVTTADAAGLASSGCTCVIAADGVLAESGPAEGGSADAGKPEAPAVPRGGGYIVLTSGTTGEPKAVQVGLDALGHRLWWGQQAHPLAASDVVLLLAHPTFDFGYWEMLAPLAFGAGLAIPRGGPHLGPAEIATACASGQVTVMHQVPSLLAANLADDAFRRALGRLRILYLGGEALPAALAEKLRGYGVTLVNQYGPAEACIDVTSHECGQESMIRTPIGCPAPGVEIRILDAALRPVPRGSAGELWLSGPCLAHGYAAAPRLTAESFRPDPYARDPGARMYRTGDRARELASGTLDLLGRADEQVKIAGVRIEPAEIESVLLRHPGVRRAASVPTADGTWLAYAETSEVPSAELAAHLRSHIPSYRLPTRVVTTGLLPMLPTGKIDRRALASTPDADLTTELTRPSHSVEPVIAEAWAKTLKLPLEAVDDDTDFFSSGGGSLQAIRLTAALRSLGYPASIRMVFETPRLADFASALPGPGS